MVGDAADGTVIAQPADLFCEPDPARGIPSEGSRAAEIVEGVKRTAGIEIHIVEHAGDFEARHKLARRQTAIRAGASWKRLRPGSLRQGEEIPGSGGDVSRVRNGGAFLRWCRRAVGIFLGVQG